MSLETESSTAIGWERWGWRGSGWKDREEAGAGGLPKRPAEGAPAPGLAAAAVWKADPGLAGDSGAAEAHVGPGRAWGHVCCPAACCPC